MLYKSDPIFAGDVHGICNDPLVLFINLKVGKKSRKREGVCQLGIPKKRHITVLEVSSERARTLGPST